jgi:hypothetical protein
MTGLACARLLETTKLPLSLEWIGIVTVSRFWRWSRIDSTQSGLGFRPTLIAN